MADVAVHPMSYSSTTGTTLHFEDGKQVFPCRCGQTHRGPYAVYDYGHHNCLHEAPLWELEPGWAICAACGLTFKIE
mgnify:CR=1 FL=1